MAETRNFKMHPKLLMDVIKRQAGSLSKAILEGVMNAVDAKATECTITLEQSKLTIVDDGGGFGSKENIYKFFEVFGQPHDESEKKTYGTFRMGRGQLFAFGANHWATGEHRMDVDIKAKGLDYELLDKAPDMPGCQVEVRLYDPMGLSDIDQTRRDIEKWCKWAPIDVVFNDKKVSMPPTMGKKWDHETADAYIRLSGSGSISIYNLGIHVCELPAYKYGCGGEVVSKKQLKVNFARNDIQSDCEVWKRVKKILNQQSGERMANKKSLDDDERQRIADQLRNKEITAEDCGDKRIFTAATGRHYSAEDLAYMDGFGVVTNAPKGDRIADMMMKRKMAFVFADETLERFGCETTSQLLKFIKKSFGPRIHTDPEIKNFETLSKGFKASFQILDESELSAKELLWLHLMQAKAHLIKTHEDEPVYGGWTGTRRVMIGVSDAANGWTDGETYVAIGREYLTQIAFDVGGITDLGTLLLHEACHEDPDLDRHDHDQAFYERYHDASRLYLGAFVDACIEALPKIAAQTETRLNKMQLKAVDKISKAGRAAVKLDKSAGKTPLAAESTRQA